MGADALFIAAEAGLGLGVIAANLLVCATVYLHRELRSLTNCLVACLALADLSVGALAVPCSVVLSLDLPLGPYACLLVAGCPLVATQFSVLVLLAIAANTHLKIRQYSLLVTRKRAVVAVTLCWLLAALVGFAPAMGWNGLDASVAPTANLTLPAERAALQQRISLLGFFPRPVEPPRREANHSGPWAGPCSFRSVISLDYLVYCTFFCGMLLPLVAMLGIYADSFRLVHRHLGRPHFKAARRSEARTAQTLFLMVGLFALCWMPLNVLNCLALFRPGFPPPPAWLDRLAVVLSQLNSLANPGLYAARKRDFGAALRGVLLRCLPCRAPGRCWSRASGSKVAPVAHIATP
uniref:adenosine receptor A2b-like n=1 Tax=Pristiophorus japonicus TaxID=55135 RepID=UPI00398F1AD3